MLQLRNEYDPDVASDYRPEAAGPNSLKQFMKGVRLLDKSMIKVFILDDDPEKAYQIFQDNGCSKFLEDKELMLYFCSDMKQVGEKIELDIKNESKRPSLKQIRPDV